MQSGKTKTALATLARQVETIVAETPVVDIHTHLYAPAFGELLLFGIDELLTYHYLVAEAFRYLDMPYDKFWALSKAEQARLVWDSLFIQHSPISESARGVLTGLQALGLDVKKRDLPALRKWFAAQQPDAFVDRCMELANVKSIYMTNSPFDDLEKPVWDKGYKSDGRFFTALRIDPLLLAWENVVPKLAKWGYAVTPKLSPRTISEVKRFLADWITKIDARYVMVSLPPDFAFPAETACNRLIEDAVLPVCRDTGLPFALMSGVKRGVNAQLKLAGDGVGVSDLRPISNLCAQYPQNKFMVTVLSPENSHELCVIARKFNNLHVFGCWWFTNVPLLIDEITRLRLELLGLSFTPQHSDARVLDQLIYKWRHSKAIISAALVEKYTDLAETGWQPTKAEIQRDVRQLFGGAFESFCQR